VGDKKIRIETSGQTSSALLSEFRLLISETR
jgi:hypothetical protein